MFGKEYIAQHVWQTYAQEQKAEAWRLYVAENLRIIGENTAKYAGGSYMSAKWADIISPKPVETRSPDEVIDHILGRLASL